MRLSGDVRDAVGYGRDSQVVPSRGWLEKASVGPVPYFSKTRLAQKR